MKFKNRIAQVFFPIAILLVVNLVFFYKHITGKCTFPWDFPLSYYAIPYFWTNSLNAGVFPFWMPFQGIGYPLLMNLQSGIFYLPNYFFAVFKLPYTLQAAAILQVFHFFLGGLGMYFLVKKLLNGKSIALIAAIAFNLYGGFFSNSEHPDIIRSFAFLPWILYALPIASDENIRYRNMVLLPFFTCLLWTGGYPGLYLSTTFLVFFYLFVFGALNISKVKLVAITGVLFVIGIVIAGISFIPAFCLKEEIARDSAQHIENTFLKPLNLTSFFHGIHYRSLPGDISMRSVHLAMPLLFFATFFTLKDAKKLLPLILTGILAYLMASGSFVYDIAIKVLSPLGLSRFPSSDYRTFFVIVLLIASCYGLNNFFQYTNRKKIFLRLTFFAALYIITYFLIQKKYTGKDLLLMGLLCLFVLACLVLAFQLQKINQSLFLCLLGLICLMDVWRVHKKDNYYVDPKTINDYAQRFGNPSKENTVLLSRIQGLPSRPERNNNYKGHKFGFIGYLTGEYMIEDYSGPMQFKRQKQIISDSNLLAFALQEWIAVEIDQAASTAQIQIIDSLKSSSKVQQTKYALNTIAYQIKADSSFSFVENETYFKGWSAVLTNKKGESSTIYPTEKNGFRYWNIPAGEYQMNATFTMPFFKMSAYISIVGLIGWLFFLIFGKRLFIRKNITA
jgi:hypothetical protein